MINNIYSMKVLFIIALLFVISGIAICGEYTEFEFDSLAGQYPNFMKPMKAIRIKKSREQYEKIKNDISPEVFDILKQFVDSNDEEIIEIFSNNKTPILSITMSKLESNTSTTEEEIQSFVNSVKRYGSEEEVQIDYSQLQITGHTFNRVDLKPSYGKKNLTTSFLVNEHNGMKYMVLILAEGNTHQTEIGIFLEKLRFK